MLSANRQQLLQAATS